MYLYSVHWPDVLCLHVQNNKISSQVASACTSPVSVTLATIALATMAKIMVQASLGHFTCPEDVDRCIGSPSYDPALLRRVAQMGQLTRVVQEELHVTIVSLRQLE